MKSDKSIKYAICLAMALASASVFAQVKVNHGVDMTTTRGLFHQSSFIYFGHYKHATSLYYVLDNVPYTNRGPATAYESTETPIVWRIMGEEASDGKITLLSEYVLDSQPYGALGSTWASSSLNSWLNGASFTNSFTAAELANVPTTATSADYWNNAVTSVAGTSSANAKFYLPWGTPYQDLSATNANKVYWTKGGNPLPASTYAMPSGADNFRGAGLKGALQDEFFNVYYWLTPRIAANEDFKLVVKSDADINFEGVGVSMGVRPIFKLDTANILFAAELMEYNSINKVDQIQADNAGIYTDEDALPNGGHAGNGIHKAFKLTLKTTGGTSPTIGSSFDYDYDETATSITDTVAMKPGEVLGFQAPAASNADGIAYKIVSDYDALMHYNFNTRMDSLFITADNIYTPKVVGPGGALIDNISYVHLNSGTMHTAYVWAQKNVATRSNEGSAPTPFTLKILADDDPPILTPIGAIRSISGATYPAKVKFQVNEGSKRGKFYYIVDPATAPTSFADFFPLPAKTRFNNANVIDIDSIASINFTDNNTHTVYIIAKDEVRNISNIISITIPVYVPPYTPTPDPAAAAVLSVGETVTFDGDSIADDQNLPADALTIISINTPPNSAIATASLSGGILSIYGVTSGLTSVTVTVEDLTNLSCTVTIPITVKEAIPNVGIEYIDEDLINFVAGNYSLNGGATQSITSTLDIPEEWFDTTVSIVKVSSAGAAYNSPAQMLYIPPRPTPPNVTGVRESFAGYSDGQIINVNDSMQYKTEGSATWDAPYSGRKTIEELLPGVYLVRYKAIANTQFASLPTKITIGVGTTLPPLVRAVYLPEIPGATVTPAAGVHYIESSTTFTFTVKYARDILGVKTSRVVDNENELLTGTLLNDGTYEYQIVNITGPVVVYIGADYTGNEPIEEQSVWASDGRLYVSAAKTSALSVYNLEGQLVKKANIAEGVSSIPLANGIYIVVQDNRRFKVSIR